MAEWLDPILVLLATLEPTEIKWIEIILYALPKKWLFKHVYWNARVILSMANVKMWNYSSIKITDPQKAQKGMQERGYKTRILSQMESKEEAGTE